MLQAFIEKVKQNQLDTNDKMLKLLYEWTKTDILNLKEFTQIANWIAGP